MSKAQATADKARRLIAQNRRALHDFTIEDHLEAGISLKGSEVKSCRAGRVTLKDSHVQVERGEAFLLNSHIAEYEAANRFNHEPTRARKLLLHRKEIDRLEVRLRQQGQSAVPLSFYFKDGRVKVDIGIGKGKTYADRRDTVREREAKREIERTMRRRR
ncbi:MAG: SsrA-binding protein SmpB [Deltaproteobacteria bacterium]|nr:SsrA-binding protein SmpB [Deltaproteobacteria bacterium]